MSTKLTAKQRKDFEACLLAFVDARDALRDMCEEYRSALQDAYDEKSERWQEGDAAAACQDRIDALESLHDELDNLDTSSDAIVNTD